MSDSANRITRRDFVAGAIVLPALAGLMLAETSNAQAKGSKAQFKYQDKPNNGHKCSQCSFYVPGKSLTANGSCKIVDGSISPNGWCTAWAKK
jgi:hypothetical protein